MSLDLDALETSLDLVAPHGTELMDAFFAERPPATGAQRAMTLRLMGLLRLCLHDVHGVVALVRDLGARHGARPEQYHDVGAALITAMAKVAGDAWQPRYDRAWATAVAAVVPAVRPMAN
jgi:hemoglobin-like flavoprotein